VNVVDWAAAIASGVVIPLSVNPVPLTAACEIVMLALLLFVNVTVWLLWVPTVTLPKLSLVGLSASKPLATPVPVNETVPDASDASLEIVTVALKAPAALGANTRVKGVLCPATIVVGKLGALIEKYCVENDAPLTVTVAVPVLDAVRVMVLVVPVVTEPKFRLATPRVSVPLCVVPC
jgi:hypothetical protein